MANQRNSVRIIGGKWGGRKIGFPSFPDLRPSGDRGRETLFNWLAAGLPNSQCLDLFAGSGCLGFEALSRGAAHVTFVDVRTRVIDCLRREAQRLLEDGSSGQTAAYSAMAESANGDTADATVDFVRADARAWLARAPAQPRFSIVFLDPPFDAAVLPQLLPLLRHWVQPGAVIYIEQSMRKALPPLPDGWVLARQSRAGAVHMSLIETSA